MGALPKHSKKRVRTLERDLKILNLRCVYKLTYRQIGAKLGISGPAAYQGYMRAVTARYNERDELGKKAREDEIALLDKMQQALIQKALKGEGKAVDRIVRISESRRKLAGLDAPTKVEATVKSDDIDKAIESLPDDARDLLLTYLAGTCAGSKPADDSPSSIPTEPKPGRDPKPS